MTAPPFDQEAYDAELLDQWTTRIDRLQAEELADWELLAANLDDRDADRLLEQLRLDAVQLRARLRELAAHRLRSVR